MNPEQGDKSVHVTREDVAAAASDVGIVEGDVAMFHSSLSSMGTVVGGPNTVIDGFLDAVGPTGTVAAPSLWGRLSGGVPSNLDEWDVDTSPTWVGAIAETLRRRPDAVRSDNPTHSVAAIGARAAELAGEHSNSAARPCCFHPDAFGSESPWQKLYEWNAAYCFIGVDFTVATMRHFVECLFVEGLLNRVPAERRDALRDQLSGWDTDGVWPHHNSQKLGERLTEVGFVRLGKIGSATLRCVRAQEWVNQSLRILRAEPREWFPDEFLVWMREAGTQP